MHYRSTQYVVHNGTAPLKVSELVHATASLSLRHGLRSSSASTMTNVN